MTKGCTKHSWYRELVKILYAIFHRCSKITSVWNWTVACVLGNLYEINFYSCLYKQNLLLCTTWLGFRKFPKWFIVICAYSMAADETDILFEHMQSFWLEKTDHLSLLSKRIEEFILWKRKKSWVFCFKWNNYLQEQNICYQSYRSFLACQHSKNIRI